MASDQHNSNLNTGIESSAPARARTGGAGAILVLGMHRSGTSAVARVINLMGAYIGEPDELLPAHPQDNPSGYYERTELVIEHDRFLAATGYAWDRIADYDSSNLDAAARRNLELKLRPIIDKLNASIEPWLVKDPRLCLLLPQWLPLIGDAAFIVVVRDPRAICASLLTSHRGAYTSSFILALWGKYLRTLLTDLAGRPALFVSYAALLANPQAQGARLLNGLRTLGVTGLHAAPKHELDSFLDVRLQRSTAQSHVLLTPAQEALHAWLDRQCEANAPVTVSDFPEAPAPDAVLQEFESAFDYQVKLGRQRALGETDARIDQIQASLNEQVSERTRWFDELAAQRQQNEQTQLEFTAQRQQNEQAQHELIAQRAETARAQGDAEALRSALSATTQKQHLLQEQTDALTTEGQQLRLQITHLGNHAAALELGMHDMRHSLSWKISAPLRAIANVLTPRVSWSLEQGLYRAYYAFPGVSVQSKRALILWLHRHASWFTRHTLSYQMRERSREFAVLREVSPDSSHQTRMDNERAKALIATWRHPPLISIVMPVYNVDPRWLLLAIDSVRRQFYPHWELCIADDASTREDTRQALDGLTRESDPKIKIVRLKNNQGIALASNAAFKLVKGKYVGLLDHDDELTRDALLEMVRVIVERNPDMVYSDEDKTDEANDRRDPFFKPDYSPEYFLSNNYICHFTVLRTALLKRIGGFRSGVDGAQDFDLFLRFTEHAKRIEHIPLVLYHWRMISGSTAATASAKPYTWEAGRLALEHSLHNRGLDAQAEVGPFPNTYRIRHRIHGEPLVSILIPFRDKPKLLEVCVRSILEKTDYQHYEILGIDNASAEPATQELMRKLEKLDCRIRFVRYDQPFNYSAINNFGARQAKGEHFLLLNNDTEVLAPEWLRAMLEHSQREDVGVVGAKLLYPDNTVQHAGVILDRNVVAMHPHQFLPVEHPGYAARPHLLQNLSAVTFACAMTRRDVFERLGGLNEKDLPICFNDVDYCLRAREAGFLVVYTPYAVLRHFESKSRGTDEDADKQIRFRTEFAYMQKRHAAILARGDPYYNPNLSLGIQGGFHADPYYAAGLPR